MGRLTDRRALVTGASSGIGRACALRLAAEGAPLVLWARRLDRLDRLADTIENEYGRHVHVAKVDVRDRQAVTRAVDALVEAGAVPDILINNAGLAAGFDPVQQGRPDDWERMIDTNIKGLLWVTRAVLPLMIASGRGHIVNIGSTAGHLTYPRGNVYAATKFAVRALTEGINLDVVGTPIRVSSVDPGFVETEFSLVRFEGDEERARRTYEGFRPLSADDVADTVAWVLTRPDNVLIHDVVMTPVAQRNVYVVDRGGGE